MTVRELIERLSVADPDARVVTRDSDRYYEDNYVEADSLEVHIGGGDMCMIIAAKSDTASIARWGLRDVTVDGGSGGGIRTNGKHGGNDG